MANIKNRKCKICNKEFTPSSCRQVYCKDLHYRECPICKKMYPEPNLDKFKFPPTTCSIECRVKKREQTSLTRYGIKAPGNNPEAREKSRQTMNSRYGVDYAQQNNKIKQKSIKTWETKYGTDNPQKVKKIRDKTEKTNVIKYGSKTYLTSEQGKSVIEEIMQEKYGTTIPLRNADIKHRMIDTNLERYGVAYPAQSSQIKEKMKNTSMQKYGTEYPQSSEIVKNRIKDTFIRNYGVSNCFKNTEIIEKIHNTFREKYNVDNPRQIETVSEKIRDTTMKRYGVPYYIMLPNVAKSSGRISKINQKISDQLSAAGIFNRMEFSIGNNGYDIIIPAGEILIEINPSYTHSTVGNHWNPKGISKTYHMKKSILAEQSGYRCIHIWDWDCPTKLIKSLSTKHRIYAVQPPEIIDIDEAKAFIEKYSLYNIAENIHNILFLGIKYMSKLMVLIGFKLVNPLTNTWMIVSIDQRFGYTVDSGNTKILNHFVKLCHPQKVVSYVDYSKSKGEILESLGFKYTQFVLPNKVWSKGRHAIVDSENIIDVSMMEDRWLPVYNCGYKVYELEFSEEELEN